MAKANSTVDVKCNSDVSTMPQSRNDCVAIEKDELHDIEDVYKIIGFGRIQWILLFVSGLYLLMVINETLGMSFINIASQCDFQINSVDKAILGSSTFLGFGRIQWIVLLVGGLFLLTNLNETLGISIITLASQCDFQTNSVEMAILGSSTYLGIAVSSLFWGYLSDTIGRRTVLIYATLTGNLLSFISMFLPSYWLFVIFRFIIGVCLSGPSASVYAYLGEFFSAYYRPIVINYACLFIGISMVYFPAVSWLVLSMDWTLNITDGLTFRPWRLIILFYLLPGFIASIIVIFLPESPRFYLSVNKLDEAYAAVDWVCRHSKGQSLADLKIYKLKPELNAHNENLLLTAKSSNILSKIWTETRPLFKRPYVVNLLICAITMMGLFMSSTGMGLWYPTIQNRVDLSENNTNYNTVCEILENSVPSPQQNVTMDHCDDTITKKTFVDSITIGVAYVICFSILGVIINPVGRKTLLSGSLGLSGIFGLVLLWINKPITILVSFGFFLVLPGVAIAVLTLVVVELMPTHLRAKAVCIVLMMGRWGVIIGSNIIGALLETHCVLTFSSFGVFALFCAALVLLLPI